MSPGAQHRPPIGCRSLRSHLQIVGRASGLWALLALAAVSGPAAAQRPPRVVPDRDGAIVGELPRGYAALGPGGGGAQTDGKRRATDLERIGKLLQAASLTGDTRLMARADALLARQTVGAADPNLLRLRAYSAQYKHDFSEAIRLLDALIAVDPRNAGARLARAEIQLVQGRIDKARADCRALVLGVDADTGLLCAASLALRVGEYESAASLLDRLMADLRPVDPRRPFALLARAEVASRAGDTGAGERYRQALAASPGDIRVRVSYARHLRRVGMAAVVERVLAGTEQSDTAQLQRTLAAVEARRPQAPALVAAQARRYAMAHAVGAEPEMRDEAEFLLVLQGRHRQALALALRNFTQQRDYEDVDILERAAKAAGDPAALEGLHAWQSSQGIAPRPPPRADNRARR